MRNPVEIVAFFVAEPVASLLRLATHDRTVDWRISTFDYMYNNIKY